MKIAIPAPTGGLNARDDYAAMEFNHAVRLNNIVPENGYCRSRGGSLTYTSGFNGAINTLTVYDDGLDSKFIACESGNIWDVSDPENKVLLKSGSTNDYYDTMMFTKKLVMVNGVDTPQIYNGGATTTDMVATLEDVGGVIAGISISDIIGCEIYKGRAFYWLEDEQRFFYADFAGSFQGVLKEFKLDSQAKKGGAIVSIFTHARDTGSGLDDYLVIMFNTGECLVYEGNDPASATDWGLVQRYSIGKLISPRSVIQKGGDNLLATNEGLINFSLSIQGASAQNENHTGSMVVNAIRSAAKQQGDKPNWEVNYFPEHSFIIVNVPSSIVDQLKVGQWGMGKWSHAKWGTSYDPYENKYTQLVLNSSTGAWCTFTGLNATTWAAYKDGLYFGDYAGNIIKAETGTNDNQDYIESQAITAFSDFGSQGSWKKATGAGLTCNYPFKSSVSFKVLSDYDTTKDFNATKPIDPFPAKWSVAKWGLDKWGVADANPSPAIWGVGRWSYNKWGIGYGFNINKTQTFFYPAQGKGYTLALILKLFTRTTEFQWYSSVIRLKKGDRL